MKPFAILASLATVGIIAAGAYYYISMAKEKAAKEKAAKEQFSYGNVIVKFKAQGAQGDPLANAASGYANLGLKKFNEGEKLLDDLKSKPDSVSKETVDAIFKSDHPFYRFLQGYCYENGIGVANDLQKAYESYNEAQKLPFSKVRHAICLIKGTGVAADPQKGIEEISSMFNFADARLATGEGSIIEEGDGYRTSLAPTPNSVYPPAAVELAKIYLEGCDGVPRNPSKALECALVAYANGLDGATKLMDTIFEDVLRKAAEVAETKFKAFTESSPEYQEAIKAFQAKNKSLKTMPELMAKETAKHMKELTQTMVRRIQAEECAKAGWQLALDGKSGISLAAFKLDCARGYDSFSATLCAAQKGTSRGVLGARESEKSLAATAKSHGINDELLVLNAYGAALDLKTLETITYANILSIGAIRNELAKLNESRPTPASLVAEQTLLTSETDYFKTELTDSMAKLESLEASSPVKSFEFKSLEADGIKFSTSETMSISPSPSAKTANPIYVASVNGEATKNITKAEFTNLKNLYDSYQSDRFRLCKIIERNQKELQVIDKDSSLMKSALLPLAKKIEPGAIAIEPKTEAKAKPKGAEGSP